MSIVRRIPYGTLPNWPWFGCIDLIRSNLCVIDDRIERRLVQSEKMIIAAQVRRGQSWHGEAAWHRAIDAMFANAYKATEPKWPLC